MIRIALLSVVLFFVGCAQEPPLNFIAQPLASGATIGSLVKNDVAVVLVLSPEDVFTCGNHVDMWLEWARRSGGELHLVFTRAPVEVERRQLALMRIADFQVAAPARRGSVLPSPREYLVDRDDVWYSRDVVAGQLGSHLLTYARQERLADLVGSR